MAYQKATSLKYLAVLLALVTIMVSVGFYLQNFRHNKRMEPDVVMFAKPGDRLEFTKPLPVCETRELCVEAHRTWRRRAESMDKNKMRDVEIADAYFKQLASQIKFTRKVEVVQSDANHTRVKILDGNEPGYEGYLYTVDLEAETKAPSRESARK